MQLHPCFSLWGSIQQTYFPPQNTTFQLFGRKNLLWLDVSVSNEATFASGCKMNNKNEKKTPSTSENCKRKTNDTYCHNYFSENLQMPRCKCNELKITPKAFHTKFHCSNTIASPSSVRCSAPVLKKVSQKYSGYVLDVINF